MVRKDFSQIIECLSRLPVELAVSTNGFFLDQHLDILDRCKVHSLNISIDSLKKETFHRLTGKDALDMVKSSIHKAVERGFKVKLNTVLIRGINDTELMDFIDWTRMTPIQIRFIEFMPFKHNRWSAEHVFSGSEILDTLKSHPVIKMKDEPNDTASSYRVEGYLGTFALISTMSQPFCSGCNRLRLTADGKLKNCLFGKDEFDLLTPFRKGESILDIIQYGLTAKHAERGGQIAGDFNAVMPETIQNRSMIAIGG
jgi:cyclic pyranopterin phosphate synthase